MRRFHSVLTLAVLALLLIPGVPATAAEPTLLTEPTADDFIRALLPPPAPGSEPATRSMVVREQTRSFSRAASIDFQVQFEFGSDRLTDDAKSVLAELATAIKSPELSPYSFLIAGHTDAVGNAAFNLTLSERRAQAVRDYLAKAAGIEPARLQDVGWGEARLLDAANPESDVNRRVEITNIGGR
ncbi:MAG: OmpA family protein [Inquilinus sp.]|nr:OmpA family protein [Inquilinus sp.]